MGTFRRCLDRVALTSLATALLVASAACGKAPVDPLQSASEYALADFFRMDQSNTSKNQPNCDLSCRARRAEFRYLVYLGQRIYAYWDEKRSSTGTDFEALATHLEQSITDLTTPTEFYLILKRWAAAFQDGHVNLLGREDDSDLEVYTAPVRLETLAPDTDHEKVVVSQLTPNSPPEIKTGDQVLAINDLPVAQALDAAEKLTSGSTRRMRRYFAARGLVDALGASEGAETLTLTVQSEGGGPRSVTLYRTAELLPKPSPVPPAILADESGIRNIKALLLPGGIGYLRIDAFSGTQSAALLEQAMARLQPTQGLLLDLRGNGGGDQSGNVVLSHLISSTITRYRASERMSDFTLATRMAYSLLPWRMGDPYASWHELQVAPSEPATRYGDKPVFALTSPRCFSSCDTFVSALKVHRLATIVGEGTGGGTGSPLSFRLFSSGYEFRYSVVRGRTALDGPIEGVGTLPDIVIEPTAQERARGVDEQLLKTLTLLQEQIRQKGRGLGGVANSLRPNLAMSSQPQSEYLAAWKSAIQTMHQGPIWQQESLISPTRAETRLLRAIAPYDELQN